MLWYYLPENTMIFRIEIDALQPRAAPEGLSDDAFEQRYPDEEACRKAWFAWRWPQGFKCPPCAATQYCELRGRQLLQCQVCRYQTSLIAGTVLQGTKLPMRVWFRAMHLLAQGKKGLSNIELGRRLGISTNAAWRVQHKLMQAMIERDRRYKLGTAGPRVEIDDAYIDGERTGEGCAADGATRPLSWPLRPLGTADRYLRVCRLCVAFKPAKPNGCAPRSSAARRSSVMVASGFAVLASSRGSSTNAMLPDAIAPQRTTLPFVGRTPCSPMSKIASSPHTVRSTPSIYRATSVPSPGASIAAMS
jgi:transposase-like protein